MADVIEHCETWHKKYAKAITNILGEVFDDMEELYEDDETFFYEDQESIVPVWDEIRNDSSLTALVNLIVN